MECIVTSGSYGPEIGYMICEFLTTTHDVLTQFSQNSNTQLSLLFAPGAELPHYSTRQSLRAPHRRHASAPHTQPAASMRRPTTPHSPRAASAQCGAQEMRQMPPHTEKKRSVHRSSNVYQLQIEGGQKVVDPSRFWRIGKQSKQITFI
jgi:hypothetical protein